MNTHLKKILVSTALAVSSVAVSHAGTQVLSVATIKNYGPSRTVVMAGSQTITIDDATGYVTAGYIDTAQNLYYGSTHFNSFHANSYTTFASNRVTSGYLLNSTTNLPYGGGAALTTFNTAAVVNFTDGSDGAGYVAKGVLVTATNLPYGPSRIATFRGSGVFTSFANGQVTQGVLDVEQNLQTSTGPVTVAASTIVNFSGGYYVP